MKFLLTSIIFSSVFVQNLFGNPLKMIETKDPENFSKGIGGAIESIVGNVMNIVSQSLNLAGESLKEADSHLRQISKDIPDYSNEELIETKDSKNFSKGIGEVIELSTENVMNIKDIPLKNNFNGNDFEKQFSSLFTEFVRTNDHYLSSLDADVMVAQQHFGINQDLINNMNKKYHAGRIIYYNNLCYRTLTSLLDVSAGKAFHHCSSIMSSLHEVIESIARNVNNFMDIPLKNNFNGNDFEKKFSGLFTEFVLTNDFYFSSKLVDTLLGSKHLGKNQDPVNFLEEKFKFGRIIYYNNLCYRTLTSLLDVSAGKAVHHCSSIMSSLII